MVETFSSTTGWRGLRDLVLWLESLPCRIFCNARSKCLHEATAGCERGAPRVQPLLRPRQGRSADTPVSG